jgi:predicted Rossmann fold nucleotide-binding protein DprA/Smf involved in DNA uptake
MIYQDQEPLAYKENELIRQQRELITQQQELIRQQQEQLNTYKKENKDSHHKKHKKTVRFQLIPFHKKMTKKKTRIATPLSRRSNSLLKL